MTPIGTCVSRVGTWNPSQAGSEEVFRYIDLGSVDQDNKIIVEAREVRCVEAPSRARQLVAAGDVLVSTVRPNLNGVARVPVELDGATASTGFCVLRAQPKKLHGGYLFQWVKSMGFVSDMVRNATGASYPAVSDRIIFDSRLPLPSIAEQRRISAILDQAETLRTQRRAALAQLDDLAQSIFLDMFGDPTTNPKRWPMFDVGKLAAVQGGIQVTTARKNLPLEVPYLRVANVYRGHLNLSEIKMIRATSVEVSRTALIKDDLLIVEGHGNPNEIGRSALWTGEIAECVHQNHIIRARFDSKKVAPIYACEYLNSPGGRRHLLRAGKTTSGLNTISVSNVREAPVALPPLKLQKIFAARVEAIEFLKAIHRAAMAELVSLFASLQHRAFSGELTRRTPVVAPVVPIRRLFAELGQLEARKGVEALTYAAKRLRGRGHYWPTKVQYLADRHHLEHHGRTIYGETHMAMPHGPVPQAAFSASRALERGELICEFPMDIVRTALRRDGDQLVALREADFSLLSAEERASLDWAIRYVADMGFDQLKTAAHDSAWKRTPANAPIAWSDIIRTLPEAAQQRLFAEFE